MQIKKWPTVFCFSAILLIAVPANALTGNDLKRYADEGEKNPQSIIRGVFFGYVLGAVESCSPSQCCVPEGVNNKQMVDVVVKYLKDHPEELRFPAIVLIQKAISMAWPCRY